MIVRITIVAVGLALLLAVDRVVHRRAWRSRIDRLKQPAPRPHHSPRSNPMLVEYAEKELRRAGLFDEDSDYNGMLGTATLDLIRVFAAQGHSGMSAEIVTQLFETVARFKPLSPITSNPDEWMEVETGKVWQSTRKPTTFSTDAGKTCYDINERRSWLRKRLRLGHWGFHIRRVPPETEK